MFGISFIPIQQINCEDSSGCPSLRMLVYQLIHGSIRKVGVTNVGSVCQTDLVLQERLQQERMNPKKPVLHAPSHITCVKKVWHAILGFLWFILLCWNQVFVDID